MPAKRYPVILDQSQRDYLLDLMASGTESARKLTPKKRSKPSRPQKFDGEKEAHLIALACSPAPEGHARWTLRLLVSEKMVELNHFSSVSHETIRRTLKKTNLDLG